MTLEVSPAAWSLPRPRIWPWLLTLTIVCLVFAVCLLLRLPVRTSYIVNWDAVQFAYALEGFDLHAHRPHPPGYIAYVWAGDLLTTFTGDANASFVLMSVLAGALAPALFFLLARRLLPRGTAIGVTVLFATSPLLWYYSGVALTYSVEAALAVAVGLLAWQARRHGGRWLIAVSLALALMGAVRQTGAVLLFPLWLWAVWPAEAPERRQAAIALVAASCAWLLPLLWLAGGPLAYLNESIALGRSAGSSTSFLSGNLSGIAVNWAFVTVSVIASLGAALFLLPGSLKQRHKLNRPHLNEERDFLLLWAAPALFVFLFLHMGQAGYVLVFTPALFLALGRLAPLMRLDGVRTPAVLGALVAVNAGLVFWLPGAVYHALPPESSMASHMRQYVQPANDAHWERIIGFVQDFQPENTAVLTVPGGPRASGSFRHVSYYLPEYNVYAMNEDRNGAFGYFYSAQGHRDNYQISSRNYASPALVLPREVEYVIILDWQLYEQIEVDFPLQRLRLTDGESVWAGKVPRGSILVFHNSPSDTPSMAGALPRLEAILVAEEWGSIDLSAPAWRDVVEQGLP